MGKQERRRKAQEVADRLAGAAPHITESHCGRWVGIRQGRDGIILWRKTGRTDRLPPLV